MRILNNEEVNQLLERKAIAVGYKQLIKQEVAERADKYQIPYDKDQINICKLSTLINEYEFLIHKAEKHNVNWKSYGYDPISLDQEIEHQEDLERRLFDQERAYHLQYKLT